MLTLVESQVFFFFFSFNLIRFKFDQINKILFNFLTFYIKKKYIYMCVFTSLISDVNKQVKQECSFCVGKMN